MSIKEVSLGNVIILVMATLVVCAMLIWFGWIDISETVRYVPLTLAWDCSVTPDRCKYWTVSTKREVKEVLAGHLQQTSKTIEKGKPILIATLRPTTFRGTIIGQKWIVLRVLCNEDKGAWVKVVEVDQTLLASGVIRLPCPRQQK